LSKLAYTEQQYEESRALAKKVLEFSPKETAPRLVYAFSLEKLNRFDEASVQFKEILKVAPENVEACYHLATVLKQQNLQCEAKEYYKKVIDVDPLSDFAQKSIAAIKSLSCPKSSN
jgi:cytochrome c-type biogenesis protein CcmH/NrfG